MTEYETAVRREMDQARALLGIPRDRTAFSDDRAGAVWAVVLLCCAGAGYLASGLGGVVAGFAVAVAVMWGIGAIFRS